MPAIVLALALMSCTQPSESGKVWADPSQRGAVRVRAGDAGVLFRTGSVRRDGAPTLSGEDRCQPADDGVLCARPGLQGWWRDHPDGVEQGWTVDDPGGTGALAVEVRVEGRTSVQGELIRVESAGGTLVGSGLAAWDARGVALSVVPTATSVGFVLTLDVDHAAWPVTIDPVWTLAGWRVERPWPTVFGDHITAADVDLDGFDDLLTPTAIHRGSPAGVSQTAAWTLSRTCAASDVAAGDVNADGWPDLAVSGCVYLGGPQGFAATPTWTLVSPNGNPLEGAAVAGDLNGDGADDLILVETPTRGQPVAHLILWAGAAGGLSPTPSATVSLGDTGAGPTSRVLLGALNADTAPDLLVVTPGSTSSGRVERLDGVAGAFPSAVARTFLPQEIGLESFSSAAALGDMDADPALELVLSGPAGGGNDLVVLSAELPPGTTLDHVWHQSTEAADDLEIADVDHDGQNDLLAHVGSMYYRANNLKGATLLFKGGAWGRQHDALLGATGNALAYPGLVTADFDGDGLLDIAASDRFYSPGSTGPIPVPASGREAVVVQPGAALGALVPFEGAPSPTRRQVARGHAARMVDLDHDGDDDLVTWRASDGLTAGFVDLHLGGPAGPSPVPTWTLTGPGAGVPFAETLALCDLNGDGVDDVVVAAGSPVGVAGWLFSPTSGFTAGPAWTDAAWLGRVALACGDLDDDGASEVVVGLPDVQTAANEPGTVLQLRSGDAQPYVRAGDSVNDARLVFGGAVAVGDLDGDGAQDLVIASERGASAVDLQTRASVWFGPAASASGPPDLVLTGSPGDFAALYAVDPDGDGTSALFTANTSDPLISQPGIWRRRLSHLYEYDLTGRTAHKTWSWNASTEQQALGTAVALGYTHGQDRLFAYSASERSHAGSISLGPVRAVPVLDDVCTAPEWEVPDGVRADHAHSVAVGDFNHDAFDDLVVGSDGCPDPDGCVFLYVGSLAGPIADPLTDADGDGHPQATDCDDADPSRYVGAPEVLADRVDSDCDGFELCYEDLDVDYYPGLNTTLSCELNCRAPGVVAGGDPDCDDADPRRHPGGGGYLPGVDVDCDGDVECFPDADGDGHFGWRTIQVVGTSCSPPLYADHGDDCDDDAAATFPGAVEIIGDNVDSDCDGEELCYRDLDSDGRPEVAYVIAVEGETCHARQTGTGPADTCFGDDPSGDPDHDGYCSNVDSCPAVAGDDPDADGVCSADRCVGDDAAGDTNRDGVCDDVSFQVSIRPMTIGELRLVGDVQRAPPRSDVRVFTSTAVPGNGPCAPGGAVCLDLRAPTLSTTVRTDASGRARFAVPISMLHGGELWSAQGATVFRGTAYKSNAAVVRVAIPR